MKADEQVIKEILQQLESAWNRYDSATFAAGFAEDANFIHIFGGQLNGRAAIEAAHRNIFETIYPGEPSQFRAAEHPRVAPRRRGGIRTSAREVQGRRRSTRNRHPPNVGCPKGTGQVANRRVPKYQNL